MKEVIIIILILLLIFAGDIAVQMHLEKTSETMTAKLENLKEKMIEAKENEDEENEGAKKALEETEKEWEDINKTWSMIVMHEELDNIEEALVKAKSSVNEGELEDGLEEIETAMFFIKHVREREKVLIKNIF